MATIRQRAQAVGIGFGLALLAPCLAARAAESEVRMVPDRVLLEGPRALQRFLVVASDGRGGSLGDLTPTASFTASRPEVARVDERGIAYALSDGETRIIARLRDGRTVSAAVAVRGASAPAVWSFRNHVLPVMTKVGCNSGPCHGAAAGQNYFKLSLRGYAPEVDYDVLTRHAGSRRVLTVAPAHSLMLLKPTLAVAHGGGKRLAVGSQEYQVISEWIAAGAPPPRDEDPRLQRLEVSPPHALLKAGERHQIVVRAFFSDGRVEDVTRWTRYATSDGGVVSVGDTGEAKVEGAGEASVSCGYLSGLVLARFTVPFPDEVAPAAYGRLASHNYIDDLVRAKLEELRIPPSPPASDARFIRRAYLDAAGILPTPAETRRFLRDTSPGRRAALVDALLERREFVDYWTYQWSDLLLVSSGKLPAPAARVYYNWIRSSVAANKPWDRFVREIFTATGGNLDNGAANYYVLHDEPTSIAENATLTFLGLSINCARCHNHPLDRWTQNDYYALANFFSRVGRKDGDRPGETTVFATRTGDIDHPRLGRPLPPRPLDGASAPDDSADRRQRFADWLTRGDNPYFVRSIVNRVWRSLMGRGLLEPVDDLRDTNPASNDRLLAALARDFVAHGFDVKHLIHTIMNSATYQADSEPSGTNGRDERCFSHLPVRRLPAEVLLDAISQVTGVPEQFAGYPAGVRALELPDTRVNSYFLTVFGRPKREANSHAERVEDSSVAQVLHLVNGDVINRKVQARGGTLDRLITSGLSDREIVRDLYLAAFSRFPEPAEEARIEAALTHAGTRSPPPGAANLRRDALEDFFAGLLMSKEFLFDH